MSLSQLPSEVLLHILSHLPLHDLLQLSRTSHPLRLLACDPVLHLSRLHHASLTLSHLLTTRRTRTSLTPPHASILLSRTHVLSRQINQSLIRIRLSHNLSHRPSPSHLVSLSILSPSCSTSYSSPVSPLLIYRQRLIQKQHLLTSLTHKLQRRPSVTSLVSLNILPEECAKRTVSPVIVAARRRVMRESLKDGLRAWVEGIGVVAQRRRADELDASGEERRTVKMLVRRFMAGRAQGEGTGEGGGLLAAENLKYRAQARWGREMEMEMARTGRREPPTRANVLRLKRFWEGVIRAAAA